MDAMEAQKRLVELWRKHQNDMGFGE